MIVASDQENGVEMSLIPEVLAGIEMITEQIEMEHGILTDQERKFIVIAYAAGWENGAEYM